MYTRSEDLYTAIAVMLTAAVLYCHQSYVVSVCLGKDVSLENAKLTFGQ